MRNNEISTVLESLISKDTSGYSTEVTVFLNKRRMLQLSDYLHTSAQPNTCFQPFVWCKGVVIGVDSTYLHISVESYCHNIIPQRKGWFGGFKTTALFTDCLLYTSPSPRDRQRSRMPSSA